MRIACFTLPHNEHLPSKPPKPLHVEAIPPLVPFELRNPILQA